MKKPIKEAVSYLIMKGWSFNKLHPLDRQMIPFKQKLFCLRKPASKGHLQRELTVDETYGSYEPEILDLAKVEIKIDLLVCLTF